MERDTVKVFVYGTLKKNKSNHWWLKEAKYVGDYYTDKNLALYVEGLPYMVREPNGGGVLGEVYEVDRETLFALDRLEGHPSFYRREDIWVFDIEVGAEMKVQAYLYPKIPKNGVKLRSY